MRDCGRLRGAAAHGALMAGAAVMAAPFAWMALTSFKPPQEIFKLGLHWLPHEWAGLDNYRNVLDQAPLLRFLVNGALVSGAIVALQTVTAVAAGYALAKLEFRGRDILLALVLVSLLVPIQAPSLFLYLVFAKVGLLNTYAGLILPFAVSAFAVFLLRQHFLSFPQDVVEAARLDGFGEFEIAWRIALPSAKSAVVAFVVFSLVAHWNDLYWPLVEVTDPQYATPALGVVFFRNQDTGSDFGALMAAATLISAPLIGAFLLAQPLFMRGFSNLR